MPHAWLSSHVLTCVCACVCPRADIGFRKIGFNMLLSFIAIFVIHGSFSYPTLVSGTHTHTHTHTRARARTHTSARTHTHTHEHT